MAGPVQLLLKSTQAGSSTKTGKSTRPDDAGDGFKTELDRASDRKNTETENKKFDDTKKTEKPDPAKKPHAKGKPRKSAEDDQAAKDGEEPVAKTDQTDNPALPDAAVDEDAATDTVEITGDPAKPVVAKDKPADPNASLIALTAPQPVQANNPEATADQPECATDVKPVADAVAKAIAPQESEPATDATADPAVAVAQQEKPKTTDAGVSALDEEDAVAIQPKSTAAKKVAASTDDAPVDDAQAIAQYLNDILPTDDAKPHDEKTTASADGTPAITPDLAPKLANATANVAKPEQVQTPPEARFAETNHPEIVKGIQTELMPRGGTMQLRLDPPELGALQVTLTMKDGVMNATFQTSSDDATRQLSHSLGQLKTALESAGVTVDKLQVTHTPRDSQANTGDDQQRQQPGQDDMSRQQEQQRKEMIKRMWRKLAGESDPLDLVA